MTTPPRVSIIIPVYNAGKYIARTLASVQNQTLSDWELILIDDGSQDTSAEIIRTCIAGDPRMHLIQQSNAGVAKSRSRGWHESNLHAPYLIFLDHDDTWEPEALSLLVTALDSDMTACAAYGQSRYIDESDQQHSPHFIAQHHYYLDEAIRRRRTVIGDHLEDQPDALRTSFATFAYNNCILSPGAVLLRRSALDKFQNALVFDPAYAPCDDWHLWVRMSRNADFLFVPHILFNYRLHSSNVSNDSVVMARGWQTVMSDIATSPDNTSEQKRIARVALEAVRVFRVNVRMEWGRENLAHGKIIEAAKQFRQAIRFHRWCRHLLNS